jgi:hypothetical protein
MSVPLVVSIPHHLGKDEATRRLKNGLAEIWTSFGRLFSLGSKSGQAIIFASRSAP